MSASPTKLGGYYMSWTTADVKKWKETLRGKRYSSEKSLYPLLSNWIKSQRPKSKVSFGGMSGMPLSIDVVEMNEKEELIGYEVKMAHVGKRRGERSLQTTYIIQGIGQAIEYLYYGIDYSYLVAPKLEYGLKHLPYMLKEITPVGLILFDRNFNFKEILKAKKVQIYSPEDKKTVEFVYFGKGVEELKKELEKELEETKQSRK